MFSVVIPTRNRSDLLNFALASVVAQNCNELEIIVSDNSTVAAEIEAGRALGERFAHDARIRFVRPPVPLGMPDHWEFATSHATGDYLLILTDRFVMRPDALRIIGQAIANDTAGPPEIICWHTEAGLAADGTFFERPYGGAIRTRSTREVLVEFAACGQWRSTLLGTNSLPRGLNSAVRRELVERSRRRHGRFYAPLAPDYTSAFHQLVAADRMVEIDFPLYAGHGSRSNGASVMRNGVATYTDQFGVDTFAGCLVPIDTVINTTIRDYLWVAETTGAQVPPIDPVGYLLLNYRELQVKRELGSPLAIGSMKRALLASAEGLPAADRDRFAIGRAEIDGRETVAFRARNLLERYGLLAPAKRLVARYRWRRAEADRRYDDVLEAVNAVPLNFPVAGALGPSLGQA
ncbi:MAG TPA: glycosyltransferase family A protein [Novosphingobium sp.]|nr:glycosyltransferase family A protein [Novosphingobium sp.]